MKFKTMFDKPDSPSANCGVTKETHYTYDLTGEIVSEEVEDLQELIQSNADSGNIGLIIAKHMLGDDSYMNVPGAFYADVSGSQDKTIHQISEEYDASIKFYESLPDDVKADFPTPESFYSTFSFDDWQRILNESTNASAANSVSNNVSEVNAVEE